MVFQLAVFQSRYDRNASPNTNKPTTIAANLTILLNAIPAMAPKIPPPPKLGIFYSYRDHHSSPPNHRQQSQLLMLRMYPGARANKVNILYIIMIGIDREEGNES
jgi:hypothetical protein